MSSNVQELEVKQEDVFSETALDMSSKDETEDEGTDKDISAAGEDVQELNLKEMQQEVFPEDKLDMLPGDETENEETDEDISEAGEDMQEWRLDRCSKVMFRPLQWRVTHLSSATLGQSVGKPRR